MVRDPHGTEAVVNYILNNPVRAGLAKTPLEHPYTWSATLEPGGGVGEHAALPLAAALGSTPPYR